MKRKTVSLVTFSLLGLLQAQPVSAAAEEGVLLPGWVGWLAALLAIALPVALGIYLRYKGRL